MQRAIAAKRLTAKSVPPARRLRIAPLISAYKTKPARSAAAAPHLSKRHGLKMNCKAVPRPPIRDSTALFVRYHRFDSKTFSAVALMSANPKYRGKKIAADGLRD
ncbi:hypothetical protein EVAR_70482_1 [Eumeta japonica]|uniref:Uncharacterized protein n=1 Tax=Eumeta variegata TaxID=151549 RepID=A0A4C1ZVC1_EUMVA|nr:hypothetical protein EVAR_70482_1 [Eumeta japonica]